MGTGHKDFLEFENDCLESKKLNKAQNFKVIIQKISYLKTLKFNHDWIANYRMINFINNNSVHYIVICNNSLNIKLKLDIRKCTF